MIPRRGAWLVLVLGLSFPLAQATAYELRTHGAVTSGAFATSRELPVYLDAVGILAADRFDRGSASRPEELDGFVNSGTPRDWMIEGVIREDDFQPLGLPGCPQPHNPSTGVSRPGNHFLDVQRGNAGLHVGPFTRFPATDWGLGVQGRGSEPAGNAFTILDARAYQLQSLIATAPADREKNTAKLFRALGQVIHLVQDMAQPQHTRNDPHLGCEVGPFTVPFGGERSWYEEYTEMRALGRRFRRRGVEAPPLSLSGYDAAPLTVDAGFGYRDFFTRDDQRGLGNFSSRNFFSAGTNLSLLSGTCGGLGLPECQANLYTKQDTLFSFTTLDNTTVEGIVTLFLRNADDQLTHVPVPGVPVTTRSLWDQHLESKGLLPGYTLNTLNYDAMADVLLPRAVGYSAGLLDYFFRGKLDVRIARVQAGDPPLDTNRLRLTGTNASAALIDGMTDGTLTILYERTNGQRVPVEIVSPPPVPDRPGIVMNVSAGASDPLPDVEFVEPSEAVVKYVVVYQGTLGIEQAGPPDAPNPVIGAVAAKTIDVGWVERVAALGDQRTLTNAKGEFTFPPAVDRLERRRFGDLNNWIVGTASLGPDSLTPDQVRAFQIARALDEAHVPLELDTATMTDHVKLSSSRLVDFPYGLDLGVQVTFSSSLQTTHQLLVAELERGGDSPASLRLVQFAPTVVNSTAGWTTRLTLDPARLIEVAGPTAGPYVWRVAEVGMDAQQRLLALIEVRLNTVSLVTQTAFEQSLNEDCEVIPGFEVRATAGGLPEVGSIWAVVDVQARRVLGVSSEPAVSIGIQSTGGNWSLWMKDIRHSADGTTLRCSVPEGASLEPDDPTPVLDTVNLTPSTLIRTVTGIHRADIRKAAATTLTPFSGTDTGDLKVLYIANGFLQAVFRLRFSTPFSGQSGYLTLLREGMRMAPGDQRQAAYLLRFARPVGTSNDLEEDVLAKWVPEAPAQTGLALNGELEAATYELKGVTSKWALVRRDGGSIMLLVDMDSKTVVKEYIGEQASQVSNDFVLLSPRHLYNVKKTHFFKVDSLTETDAPPALFGAEFAAPDPGAAYQVFGRR